MIHGDNNSYGIVGINVLGNSAFSNITNNYFVIVYYDTKDIEYHHHSLLIDNYRNIINNDILTNIITFTQQSYKVNVTVMNSLLRWQEMVICFSNTGNSQSIFKLKSCLFKDIYNKDVILILMLKYIVGNAIWFENCAFSNIVNYAKGDVIYVDDGLDVHIFGCNFYNNSNVMALSKGHYTVFEPYAITRITIANTNFSSNAGIKWREFIRVKNVDLHIIGPVIFHNISNCYSIIKLDISNVTISNYIEFRNITAKYILDYLYINPKYFVIFVMENTTIKITPIINVLGFTSSKTDKHLENYPSCFFQYLSDKELDNQYFNHNYSVILSGDAKNIFMNLSITHCKWLPKSAFRTAMPLKVNSNYIRYTNQSGEYNASRVIIRRKHLCLCDTNVTHDCYKDLLDPLYPGQTMSVNIYTKDNVPSDFKLSNSTIITVVNNTDWLPPTACVVTDSSELLKTIKNGICTTLNYTIAFPTQRWCELFLRGYHDNGEYLDIYYIEQLPCPIGFTKINGKCQCYPFLHQYSIKCNINDRTLLRPANFWIAQISHNNSIVYSLSLECPFHYCLPHSSHLSFYTPNSQCQFSRAGILCGHCQQGLSTVLGSFNCQQCSNVYLFLIIPIAIASLVLVLLLFILNLTVADGTVNAFILYVNIVSINTPVFFPKLDTFTPAYIFVSLGNLDLGIQTCFYNGMDDYAKMWLQLAFPFYLILIALSVTIVSRYPNKLKRFTADRAIPVLATLFLLSYTKTLLAISSVLFYYTEVIHLPSKHTTIMWSVDANIPIFGVKFILLFIACIALFLILLPFNITLLFTRTLLRYKFIRNFRPLLDAYQGPYEMKYYYWPGVQLVIRIVFYGISSLDRNINLTIGVILLTMLAVFQGWTKPFKKAKTFKNFQELMFTINLQLLFVISLSSRNTMSATNTMVAIAAVHFTIILLYHIITYTCNGVIRHRIEKTITKMQGLLLNRQQVGYYDSEEDESMHHPQGMQEVQELLMGFDS